MRIVAPIPKPTEVDRKGNFCERVQIFFFVGRGVQEKFIKTIEIKYGGSPINLFGLERLRDFQGKKS